MTNEQVVFNWIRSNKVATRRQIAMSTGLTMGEVTLCITILTKQKLIEEVWHNQSFYSEYRVRNPDGATTGTDKPLAHAEPERRPVAGPRWIPPVRAYVPPGIGPRRPVFEAPGCSIKSNFDGALA